VESQANLLQIEESQKERTKVRESFAEIAEAERKQEYFVVMNWLSSTEVILDQEAAAGIRKEYPRSGRWIFSDPILKAWLNPASTLAPLVWVNGKPGAGKFTNNTLAAILFFHLYNPT
jgi:hypothetical protein